MKAVHYYLIVLLVIVLDQVSKMAVYFNMTLNESIPVLGTWFRLHYILNEGMAFGITLDNEYGKLFLSLFRIIAIAILVYFFRGQIKEKANKFLLISLALIIGGAIGNGIDSVFYGVLLDNAAPGSISPWLHGQVIDMLYFPLFNGRFPEWLPLIGGNYFSFFSAIFNLADSAIFLGAVSIIIFHNRMFAEDNQEETPSSDPQESKDNTIESTTQEQSGDENLEEQTA